MSRLRLNQVATPAAPASGQLELFFGTSGGVGALMAQDGVGDLVLVASMSSSNLNVRLTKAATPAAPPANRVDLIYSSAGTGVGTPIALMAQDESGNLAMLGHFATLDYRLIKRVYILKGTTTYTPSNGVRALFVECLGAGGAGGSCLTAATNSAAAGGGGGAGYAAIFLTGASIKASYTVAVGAGGTAGAAGANPGNNGGSTTFDSPSVCTATGGTGGQPDTVAVGPRIPQSGGGPLGGSGGVGTAGDLLIRGAYGGNGIVLTAAQAISGGGGDSLWGSGLSGGCYTANGQGGPLYGAGGAGACIISGGPSVAGGPGANGLMIVWEFA